jgi:hypothetical protein
MLLANNNSTSNTKTFIWTKLKSILIEPFSKQKEKTEDLNSVQGLKKETKTKQN